MHAIEKTQDLTYTGSTWTSLTAVELGEALRDMNIVSRNAFLTDLNLHYSSL